MPNDGLTVEVEIVRDYKNCYRVGMKKIVPRHFAKVLIDLGYAVKSKRAERNKMIAEPVMEK